MTLNEIAYNIKNIVEGGAITLDSNISIRQIEAMIHYHRAQLLLKYTDNGRYISSAIISQYDDYLDDGGYMTIPPVLGFSNNKAIVSIEIRIGGQGGEKQSVPLCYGPDKEFFFESRFGPSDERIIAVIEDDEDDEGARRIYFYSGLNELATSGKVIIRAVSSQPLDGPNGYPIPDELIPTLVSTVLSKEFNVMLTVGKDYINNTVDDNIPGVAAANIKASAQPSATARSRKARTR
tara:strand:+ start:1278 stop:1985 length:708 start_codon:yes stop_codon:yes gene_type:complete